MNDELPWPFAGRVAGLVAGEHPLGSSYLVDHLATALPPIVERAAGLVAQETGLELTGHPEVLIVSRRDWIDRNLGSFSHMLEPAERNLAERFEKVGADSLGPALARRLVAAETGALLGFLARRVLGQYELVLPTGEDADTISFVGSNILALERSHQLRPPEFRLWVALHEVTHRAQFAGVAWMRPHFMTLVEEMVASSQPDDGRLRRVLAQVIEARRSNRPLVDERGLFGLFASTRQLEVLDRIQALMSLLEGHGHVVMDRIGARVLTAPQRMSSILKARRADPKLAAFLRITGLEMKMRQYELGEAFVQKVESLAGWEVLDIAWTSPEKLPTLQEISEPRSWLDRVA